MAHSMLSDEQRRIRGCAWNSFWLLITALIVYAVCVGGSWLIFDAPKSFGVGSVLSMTLMFLLLFFLAEYPAFNASFGAIGGVAFWSAPLHLALWWLGSISSFRYVWFGVTLGLILTAVASWPTSEDIERMKKRHWRTS